MRDLLDPVPGQDLSVRQDPQEGVVVQGATEGECFFVDRCVLEESSRYSS